MLHLAKLTVLTSNLTSVNLFVYKRKKSNSPYLKTALSTSSRMTNLIVLSTVLGTYEALTKWQLLLVMLI